MLVKFIYLISLSLLSFKSIHCQDICNFTVSLQRNLQGEGFHRNHSYRLEFENHSLHKKNPVYFYDGCILGVQQLLPSGIYVDPDELANLRRTKELSAYPHNGVNIEVAAPYARPFNAYIFNLIKFNKVDTFLPLHARYQSPVKGGGKAENIISVPSTYIRCPDNRLEDCDMPIVTKTYLCDKDPLPEEKCIWKQVTVKTNNITMKWDVPVGDLNYFYLVETGTMLTVVIGSLILMKAIHDNQMSFSLRRVV